MLLPLSPSRQYSEDKLFVFKKIFIFPKFILKELEAAMTRQGKHLYEFGPFRLDPAERLLLRHGKPVPLPHTTFEILLALVERHGNLVEKEELIKRVWQGSNVEEANLTVNISILRAALGDDPKAPRYIETVSKHGYRFVAKVKHSSGEEIKQVTQHSRSATNDKLESGVAHWLAKDTQAFSPEPPSSGLNDEPASSLKGIEPVGGAVPLDSQFYIVRSTDDEFRSAIARQDSIVLVKGARQVGKTSLLARGLHQAREGGARIILTDFQSLNAAYLKSVEKLLLALAESITDQLDLDVSANQIWNPQLSPSVNLDRYLRREVFVKIASPIVWGLDEVDRLFTCHFGSEIFGLFRSWHNKRALDPGGAWCRFTLAIAYATEPHLFITDLNLSPFNVGTRLLLEDFTFSQVRELNRRFGSPLRGDEEAARYFRLVGGQPYLAHRGLHEMAAHGFELAALESQAAHDSGLFGDHLRRILISLARDSQLCEVVRRILRGQPCSNPESFYRLRSAGLVVGDSPSDAKLRCGLYAIYLEKHLCSPAAPSC